MSNQLHGPGSSPGRVSRRAGELFDGGLYCAESVARALAEESGMGTEVIPAIATGFCSGMARTGGQCGAVSGAVIGIGLKSGREQPGDDVAPTYELVQEFLERFRERFGTTNCFELIGCDLNTDEGQRKFEEEGLIEKCRQYTAEAAGMAAAILGKTRQPEPRRHAAGR
jgi:C_GCAxxG_C_C family probable redox protein